MTDRTFDVKLMTEFDGSVTRQALTEWIEKAELACDVKSRKLNMFFPYE